MLESGSHLNYQCSVECCLALQLELQTQSADLKEPQLLSLKAAHRIHQPCKGSETLCKYEYYKMIVVIFIVLTFMIITIVLLEPA